MSSGVNHNINGANHVKWSESQYRWSESHQVLCSLNYERQRIGFNTLFNTDDILHLHHIIDLMDAPITIRMTSLVYLIVIHKASQYQLLY